MTAVTPARSEPTDSPTVSPAAAPTVGAVLRRWRLPGLVVLAVVLVGLMSAFLARTDTRDALDPRSASPEGSRAVAQVLAARGVRVQAVSSSDDAVSGAGRTTTIVVTRPSLIGPEQLRLLADTPADLVLVEPDLVVLDSLAPGLNPAGVAPAASTAPSCSDPDALAAGTVSGGGHLYAPTAGAAAGTAVGCYPGTGPTVRYSVVRVRDGARTVTVLGQRELVQNGTFASDGNAALALRVLGARADVRWYLPDPAELGRTGDSPTLGALLPDWFGWAFWQLVVVVAVAMLWRGRRLGRIVVEPLPVVVRSAETVEGRARLYRAGRARGRAAAVLRTAAVRRLAGWLGVPAQARPEDVAQVVAATTGGDPAAVHALLLGPPPRDDAGLVALAGALDALERTVAGRNGTPGRYGDRQDPDRGVR